MNLMDILNIFYVFTLQVNVLVHTDTRVYMKKRTVLRMFFCSLPKVSLNGKR